MEKKEKSSGIRIPLPSINFGFLLSPCGRGWPVRPGEGYNSWSTYKNKGHKKEQGERDIIGNIS
jgi:hypothetical protein